MSVQIRKALSLSDVSLKFSKDGKTGQFEGYASKFNGTDSYGDTILPGAFAQTLAQHAPAKMFINHKAWDLPVGKWLEIREDEIGLFVRGELTIGMAAADDLFAAMKHGTIDGMSIGFMLSRDDYEWKEGMDGRIIKRVSMLVEISVVTFPADGDARIEADSVKSALTSIQNAQDLESFLRDSGSFSKAMATAIVERAQEIFRPEAGGSTEGKAATQVANLLTSFTFPAGLGQ
jgi:HK97 family phage prohead protease